MSGSSRINDNLVAENGRVSCVHCRTVIAESGEPALQRALQRRGDISLAGPHVRASEPLFTSEPVEFRQRLCPGCHTALLTEVAASADGATRELTITTPTDT